MKTYAFFLMAALNVCYINAQLTVDTMGVVTVNSTSNSNGSLIVYGERTGIRSEVINPGTTSSTSIMGVNHHNTTGTSYGIYGEIFNSNGSSSITGTCYGVYGYAHSGASCTNYGVYGRIQNDSQGAAIYGLAIGSNIYTPPYAGLFKGNVCVVGDFRVTGTAYFNNVYGASTSSASPSSATDLRSDVGSTATNLLSGLKASAIYLEATPEPLPAEDEELQTPYQSDEYERRHYVLDADQLEDVFPDLVRKEEDGTKSINYVEMVPILVQAVNELQQELDELGGNSGQAKKAIATGNGEIADAVTMLSMGQNNPNPFSNTTTIEVTISEDVQNAFIYIYDLQGKKLQQVDITSRGKQSISIDASSYVEGMYLYSLIADGKVVDTRRMIVEH